MKKRLLGIFLAASLAVSGLQAPTIAHASEVYDYEEQVAVAAENVTCELVAKGSVENPDFIVQRGRNTLVPSQNGALSYVLNNLTEEGDKITLSAGNVELTADATVKPGVTVLIPYADGKIKNNADKADGTQADAAYSTLVVKEGVRLHIQGSVIVTAETGQKGVSIQNGITGGYAVIQTEDLSIIDVDAGATLEVYGNIKGTGNLVARAGASVTDRFMITGYQGNGGLVNDFGIDISGNMMDLIMKPKPAVESDYPYPLNHTGCAGIDIDAKYYKGSTLYGKTKLYVSQLSSHFGEPFLVIGEGELDGEAVTGLYLHGTNENSYIERIVTPEATDDVLDKEIIRFVGGGTLTPSRLRVNAVITVDVTTENFIYPVGSQTTIEMLALSGADNTYRVARAFKFLKGSKLTIGQGANLVLSEAPFSGTFGASTNGTTVGKPSTGFLVFYDGTELILNGLLSLEKDGTLAISKENITMGATGKISIDCANNPVTTLETREKAGKVTTEIDWSKTSAVFVHGETDWKQSADGHTGTCATCGTSFEQAPHENQLTEEILVDCDTDGKKIYTCVVCGYVTEEETAKAYGHADEKDIPWEIRENHHVKQCTNHGCDYLVREEEHQWEGERIEPTYTEEGYEDRSCKVCGEYRKGPIAKLQDDIVPDVDFELDENRVRKWFNEKLGKYFHISNDNVTVKISAVDNETGLKSFEYYISEVALSEKEVSQVTGWTPYQGELKSVEDKGHFELEFSEDRDYFIYVKATDNSDNVAIHGVEGETLELIVAIDRVAAEFSGLVFDGVNCGETTVTIVDRYIDTDNVYVNGKKVEVSDDGTFVLQPSSEPYTIKAIDLAGNETPEIPGIMVNSGHDFTNYEILDGVHRRECKTCGFKEEAKHNYTPYEVIQEQSCDKDAISVRYCKDCGAKDESRKNALGHDWKESQKVAATARKDGYIKYVCRACGKENVKVLPVLNGGGASSGTNGGAGTSGSPATNDSTNIWLWTSIGLAALVVAYTTRKKYS